MTESVVNAACELVAPIKLAAPVYSVQGANASLCGFDMSQNLLAYPTWNYVILQERPKIVIELGTQRGGLSCLLGKTCEAIGCEFHTFDIAQPGYIPSFVSHHVQFHKLNVLEDAGSDVVKDLLKRGKAIVLCDNGKKVDEFNRFAPFVKPGDIIAAHDYVANKDMHMYWSWHELNIALIMDNCSKLNLEPYRPEWFDRTAWFVRKAGQ